MSKVKKIKKRKFELSVDYEEGKAPFKNQQLIGRIRKALRAQVALMDEDGSFGKYQGYSAKVHIKLKDTEYEGE